MVELLAAGLTGSQFSYEAADDSDDSGANNSPSNHGELIILIDPVVTSGGCDGYLQHCETLFERILEEEGTRLPSMRRYANRKKTPLEGITIPLSLYDEIVALGDAGRDEIS